MKFTVAAPLLDACVLGMLSAGETYGYDLTQRARQTIEISESTLYPVLRRLQKEMLLETYDLSHNGRNRRYYKITGKGREALCEYTGDWFEFKRNVDKIFGYNEFDENNGTGGGLYLPEPGE